MHSAIAGAQSLAQGFLPGNAWVAATTRAIEASDRRTIRTRICTSPALLSAARSFGQSQRRLLPVARRCAGRASAV